VPGHVVRTSGLELELRDLATCLESTTQGSAGLANARFQDRRKLDGQWPEGFAC